MKSTRCSKCKLPPVAEVVCGEKHRPLYLGATCSVTYARCDKHGGEAGARRSLHSHKALFHPQGSP